MSKMAISKAVLLTVFLSSGGIFSRQVCKAQSAEKETLFLFAPRLSFNFSPNKPSYTTQSGAYEFSAGAQQKYNILYPDGNFREISPAPLRIGADIGFKRLNPAKHQAWSLLLGADWGTEFYPSNSTYSSRYKGSVYSGWHELFSYWQLNGAITKYWLRPTNLTHGVFLRLGVGQPYKLTHLKYADKTFRDSYPASYVDSGSGDYVTLKDYRENNISLIPEFGFVDKWLEASISTTLPLQSSFTEVHTLYEKGKVIGQNDIVYRLGGIFLTIRGVLNVARHVSKPPQPKEPSILPEKGIYTKGQVVRLDYVYFEASTPKLLTTSYVGLNELILQMQQQPTLRIRLEGHTDVIGNIAQHQRLSEERVAAIKSYMVKNGIASRRIELRGYGDTRPLNTNCPLPNGCPENRRVEFVVIAN